jgi:hypothetical protein
MYTSIKRRTLYPGGGVRTHDNLFWTTPPEPQVSLLQVPMFMKDIYRSLTENGGAQDQLVPHHRNRHSGKDHRIRNLEVEKAYFPAKNGSGVEQQLTEHPPTEYTHITTDQTSVLKKEKIDETFLLILGKIGLQTDTFTQFENLEILRINIGVARS